MNVESKPEADLHGAESEAGTRQISSWLASAGLELPTYMGPRTRQGRLSVVVLGTGTEQEAALTVATLLTSSFQDFRVTLPAGLLDGSSGMDHWLANDDRFAGEGSRDDELAQSEAVLVLPAGLLLTKYSIEALFEAVQEPGISVVRAVVPGGHQALEFWDAEFLRSASCGNAERVARRNDAERWIDGAALGLYFAGDAAPKVFFRRGAADRHIVDVNVLQTPPKPKRRSWAPHGALRSTLGRRLGSLRSQFGRLLAHG